MSVQADLICVDVLVAPYSAMTKNP